MSARIVASSVALTLTLLASPALAGACAPMIDRAQAQVDARIDSRAGTGDTAAQSTDATLHRQPTPGSIAQAEQKAGDGKKAEEAVALLAKARKADADGDLLGCESALQALRALGAQR